MTTGQEADKELCLPTSSRAFTTLKHPDHVKNPFLGQRVHGDGTRGPGADDSDALHRHDVFVQGRSFFPREKKRDC